MERNEGEWTGKVEIRTRKKFLAVGNAYVAVLFRPTLGFKREIFVSSGFSTEGNCASAPSVSPCGK